MSERITQNGMTLFD